MFFLTRPTSEQIEAILVSQRTAVPSYSLEGATRDYNRVHLGSGERIFQAAKRTLQDWQMMDLGWLRVVPSGREVAIVIRHYGFWSVNVARILEIEDNPGRYSIRYGTLREHAESGQERFAVFRQADDSIWYEIEAWSRPRHFLARAAYPLTRALQKRFARDSLRRMAIQVRQSAG